MCSSGAPGTDVLGAAAVRHQGGGQPVGPAAVHRFTVAVMGRAGTGQGRALTGAAAPGCFFWGGAGVAGAAVTSNSGTGGGNSTQVVRVV